MKTAAELIADSKAQTAADQAERFARLLGKRPELADISLAAKVREGMAGAA